ncbi:MAG: translation initiation factor IF-6 [Candidatus Woesearchaeota archaeon]
MVVKKKYREHILITNVNSNPNIGLYGYATDKYCLLGREVPEKVAKHIGEILQVPIIQLTIGGTSLLGIFLSGNKNCVLVPGVAFPQELEILHAHKIKYKLIDTKFTCLGNNMICNDKGALISEEYGEREAKLISLALKVPVERAKIADLSTVGSLAVHTKKGMLAHHDILEHEAELIKKVLHVDVSTGTVNMGVPFIGSGIICNKHGFIIGDSSGGPEIMNADEALGFIKK